MATGDVQVQSAVHSLEQGQMATLIKAGMFLALLVALVLLYLFVHFKGLNDPSAMDQSQIARNLAAGKGFTTNNLSPLALATLKSAKKVGANGESIDVSNIPDFYQSPLIPFINSFTLRLIKDKWVMSKADIVYAGDRMVAFTAMVFMLLGIGVWSFVFAKLFDWKLAFFAACGVIVTDLLWQFSLSGLPQMVLLFLFGCASLLTLYAEEAQERGALVPSIILIACAGLSFGLMILAHGLAFWLFLGWLVYAAFVFRPRGLMCLAAVAAALLLVAPWLMRNYQVCGNPFGLAFMGAIQSGMDYLRMTEPGGGLNLQGVLRRGLTAQLGVLPSYLGLNVAALAFFLAIMHRFRNEGTSNFRWGLVAMWVFSLIGMAFYRPEGEVSANQVHIVFLPIFVCYGFAFLLVLWGRWELGQGLLRVIFICFVIFLCGVPMIMNLLAGPSGRVQWPPYVPPFIGILGEWFEEDEVICTDMPWAVGWYANRKALLIPESVREFNRIHDYQELKQPIRGLYLTPVSGNQPLYSQIYKGKYREWALLITRPPQVQGFPLAFYTALPIDGECILFSDRERWK
jgi:hypothetical protein